MPTPSSATVAEPSVGGSSSSTVQIPKPSSWFVAAPSADASSSSSSSSSTVAIPKPSSAVFGAEPSVACSSATIEIGVGQVLEQCQHQEEFASASHDWLATPFPNMDLFGMLQAARCHDLVPDLEMTISAVTTAAFQLAQKRSIEVEVIEVLVMYSYQTRHSAQFYKVLNDELRLFHWGLEAVKKKVREAWAPFLYHLFTSIKTCPTVAPNTRVYRGVPVSHASSGRIYRTGMKVTYSAITSTSLVFSMAWALRSRKAQFDDFDITVFSFDISIGYKISSCSVFEDEEEVLLLPGSEFIVADSEMKQLHRVCLESDAMNDSWPEDDQFIMKEVKVIHLCQITGEAHVY
jgi:hypothetical protein